MRVRFEIVKAEEDLLEGSGEVFFQEVIVEVRLEDVDYLILSKWVFLGFKMVYPLSQGLDGFIQSMYEFILFHYGLSLRLLRLLKVFPHVVHDIIYLTLLLLNPTNH